MWRSAARAGMLGALLVVLAPRVASAQAGFYLTPSLGVAEVYDDNLFSTSTRREKDLISRFTPGIEVGYRSAPLTLLGRYAFDTEVYVDHPELNDPQVRQEAALDLEVLPTRVLKLGLTGVFTETQVPGELNVETGLVAGRVRAQRLSLSPSLSWKLDPLTTATAKGVATDDEVEGGFSTRTYVGTTGLGRRLGRRDAGSVAYSFRRFVFDGDETSDSHVMMLGWTHEFTPLTSVTLRGGPRFSERATDPEASATLDHRFRLGGLALTYARTQSTVIGEIGTVVAESLTTLFAYEPVRLLRLTATPSVFRSRSAVGKAMVYAVNLEAAYRITKWLTLGGSYSFGFQRGNVVAEELEDEEISRNVVLLRLTVTYPYRLR